VIEHGVCYLTLADRSYPKKLAYQARARAHAQRTTTRARTHFPHLTWARPCVAQYLEELSKEFYLQNGTQTAGASRPYAFIKFDTFIQKTKKLYLDTRTQRNVNKLNEELAEIQGIMTRNIADVLGAGERLEAVSAMSSALSSESKRYAAKAKALSRQALLRQWAPLGVVVGVVLALLWLRWLIGRLGRRG
jgi:vesicle transport protein SEC22